MRTTKPRDPMPLLRGLAWVVLGLMGAATVYAIWIAALNWPAIGV